MKRGTFNGRAFGFGILIANLSGLLGCAFLATLTLNGRAGDGRIPLLVYAIQLLSAFTGGIFVRRKDENPFASVAVALSSFVIILLLGLLCFEGRIVNVTVGAIMYILGGCVAGVLPKRVKKVKRRRH